MVRDPRELIFVEDRVNGRRSTFIGLERVPAQEVPNDAQVSGEVVRLRHIPYTAGRSAGKDYLLNKLPWTNKKQVETTDTLYPLAAVDGPRIVNKGRVGERQGGMEKVVILHEDIYGNSPYSDFVGESRQESLAELQGRAQSAEMERDLEELDNTEYKDDSTNSGGGGGSSLDELDGRSPRDTGRGGKR